MGSTVTQAPAPGAKAKGRPVHPALAIVEQLVDATSRELNLAKRIAREVQILDHLRPLLARVEHDLIEDLHQLSDVQIPELRAAAGNVERMYLAGRRG